MEMKELTEHTGGRLSKRTLCQTQYSRNLSTACSMELLQTYLLTELFDEVCLSYSFHRFLTLLALTG